MTRLPLTRLIVVLSIASLMASCSTIRQSRVNPFNWFGNESREVETTGAVKKSSDGRQLVMQVTDLSSEPVPTGLIVRATGLPPTQGWWEAALVPRPIDENGRLVLEFRISAPLEPTATSTQASREVVVARYLTNARLRDVREIVVEGATNARALRR